MLDGILNKVRGNLRWLPCNRKSNFSKCWRDKNLLLSRNPEQAVQVESRQQRGSRSHPPGQANQFKKAAAVHGFSSGGSIRGPISAIWECPAGSFLPMISQNISGSSLAVLPYGCCLGTSAILQSETPRNIGLVFHFTQ